MTKTRLYQDDLARVHIEGHGRHWKSAAPAILRWLSDQGIDQGKLVDLGCGGGEWLELAARQGYAVCGVDVSPSMLREARRRNPSAQLIRGSFADIDIPTCDAVTSIGEPINYLDGQRSIRRVFRKVFGALRPGGMFIFDCREPAIRPVAARTVTRLADTWACIAIIHEAPRTSAIVRDITTFVRTGVGYRKSEEVHRLKVYPKRDILGWLRAIGFRVRSYRAYGDYELEPRQAVFVARRPA